MKLFSKPDKEVCSSYVRSNNVYKLMTIPVCVHQRLRGGGRECNQHILHQTRLVHSGWLDFSNFKVSDEFSTDEEGQVDF